MKQQLERLPLGTYDHGPEHPDYQFWINWLNMMAAAGHLRTLLLDGEHNDFLTSWRLGNDTTLALRRVDGSLLMASNTVRVMLKNFNETTP